VYLYEEADSAARYEGMTGGAMRSLLRIQWNIERLKGYRVAAVWAQYKRNIFSKLLKII